MCCANFSVSFFLWQRAFSPEGLSEMWNEMVKDEEITFNGEESAHPGMALRHYSIHLPSMFFTDLHAAACL